MKKKKLKAKLIKTKLKLIRAQARVIELESKLASSSKPVVAKSDELKPAPVKPVAVKPMSAKPVVKAKGPVKPRLASAARPKAKVIPTPRRPIVKTSAPAPTPEPVEEVVAAIERSDTNDGDRNSFPAAAGDTIKPVSE